MNLKKVLLILISALLFQNIFAQKNPYSTADNETKKVLETSDSLLNQRKYESAFKALNNVEENEYIISKKIEICINYFAHSTMHQLFCFKDLEPNQTLYEVRTQDGEFSYIYYDPVKIINDYTLENGEKPILNYQLGLYYSSVFNCYQGNWLISDEEILNNVIKYLQKALDENCYDGWSLSELALAYTRKGDDASSKRILERKISEKEEMTVEDEYNYALVCFYQNDLDTAKYYIEKSIQNYSNNPHYQFDAYYVASGIYINLQEYDKAEDALNNCILIYSEDYRVYERELILFAIQQNIEKTIIASQSLFSLAPTNPTVSQMIIQDYFDYGVQNWLPTFFEQTKILYADNLTAIQNLYFHHAAALSYLGKTEEASQMASEAKLQFQKDNQLTPEVEEILNSLINYRY